MVLLPRNLGTIAVERISGIEPWPRHASRIPLNSFVRFTIRFTPLPSRDHDTGKVEGRNGRSSRCDDRRMDPSLPREPLCSLSTRSTPPPFPMLVPIKQVPIFSLRRLFVSC